VQFPFLFPVTFPGDPVALKMKNHDFPAAPWVLGWDSLRSPLLLSFFVHFSFTARRAVGSFFHAGFFLLSTAFDYLIFSRGNFLRDRANIFPLFPEDFAASFPPAGEACVFPF